MGEVLVDIIVPTFRRKADVQNFVKQIGKQNYSNFMVYFVDDCGGIDLEDVIPSNDKFTLITLPKNIGQSGARNIALERGKGQVVVSMDDDAWFYEDSNALRKVVQYFSKNDKLGCLMFNIKEPDKDWLSDIRGLNEGDELGSHITCGCAYSREALESITGFSTFFHSGAEETDVSIKLILAEYKILFSKDVKVFHNYIGGERTREWYNRVRYNTTRNDLIIVLLYYPFWNAFKYFIGKYISHLKFSIFHSRKSRFDQLSAAFYTFLAPFGVLRYIPKVIRGRKSFSNNKFKEWISIRW